MAVFISQEFLLLVRNKKLASCSFQYGYIVTFLSKLFIFLLLSSNFFSFKIHFFFFFTVQFPVWLKGFSFMIINRFGFH